MALSLASTRTRRQLAIAALLSTTLVPSTAVASAAAAGTAHPTGWHRAMAFGPGSVDSIAAPGRSDVWLASASVSAVSVDHWNGSRWRSVPTPRAMSSQGGVVVGASSASDAWAFTLTRPAIQPQYAVAWHWSGPGWRRYQLPGGTFVGATAVFSRTSAWAFGYRLGRQNVAVPYAARFDGSRWTSVAPPPVRPESVSPLAPDDIWIAGPAAGSFSTYEAAQWNGHSWRVLALPRLRLPARTAISYAHILAVGPHRLRVVLEVRHRPVPALSRVVLLHDSGTMWTRVPAPRVSFEWAANLTPDHRGGFWLAIATQRRFGSALYHYGKGSWHGPVVLAPAGQYAFVLSMATLPGAVTPWAAGYNGHLTGALRERAVLYIDRR